MKEKEFYILLKSGNYRVNPTFDTIKNKVIEVRLLKKQDTLKTHIK